MNFQLKNYVDVSAVISYNTVDYSDIKCNFFDKKFPKIRKNTESNNRYKKYGDKLDEIAEQV